MLAALAGNPRGLRASYLSLLTGGAFGAEYKDILAFSILILILIFRPKGLLARSSGSARDQRASREARVRTGLVVGLLALTAWA